MRILKHIGRSGMTIDAFTGCLQLSKYTIYLNVAFLIAVTLIAEDGLFDDITGNSRYLLAPFCTSKLVGFVNITKSSALHAFKKLIDKLACVFSIVRYSHVVI